MLDGTLKTMLVDDSQPVANLMVVICTKIGITNHDEYSLVRELMDEETENQKPGNFGTLTLKRRKEEKGERDAKMDQLRKKLKTDDEGNLELSYAQFFDYKKGMILYMIDRSL
jgi:talin